MDRRTLHPTRNRALAATALVALAVPPLLRAEVDSPLTEPSTPRAFLGVQLREATGHPEGGARVIRVVAGSPADEAGLLEGDVILELDGAVVRGPAALTDRIRERRPGASVALEISRGGARRRLEARLVEGGARRGADARLPLGRAPDADSPERDAARELYERRTTPDAVPRFSVAPLILSWSRPKLGVQLVETTPELREHLGGDRDAGVLVSKILRGTPAERAGLAVGDLILAVDGERVATSQDLIRALADKDGRSFPVELIRDRKRKMVEVKIPDPTEDRPTGPRA